LFVCLHPSPQLKKMVYIPFSCIYFTKVTVVAWWSFMFNWKHSSFDFIPKTYNFTFQDTVHSNTWTAAGKSEYGIDWTCFRLKHHILRHLLLSTLITLWFWHVEFMWLSLDLRREPSCHVEGWSKNTLFTFLTGLPTSMAGLPAFIYSKNLNCKNNILPLMDQR
jgi:hypothetical protein